MSSPRDRQGLCDKYLLDYSKANDIILFKIESNTLADLAPADQSPVSVHAAAQSNLLTLLRDVRLLVSSCQPHIRMLTCDKEKERQRVEHVSQSKQSWKQQAELSPRYKQVASD